MNDNVTKIIYYNIKQKLNLLSELIPDNENLVKLQKVIEYFKKDKEGLLIIRNGLKNINRNVSEIKKTGKNNLSSTLKDILVSVNYNEN